MIGALLRVLRAHRSLPVGGLGAIGVVVALSGCAVGGETCELTGSANFSPGLSTKSQPFSYSFSGALSHCTSTAGDSSIKSGTISASGSGSGSCGSSSTSGTATIAWNNGKTTTIPFKTTGALAGVLVTGTASSGEFAGHSAAATLVFSPTGGPTACLKGATSATFTGVEAPS